MTFLQVWVATVRESRKLRNPPNSATPKRSRAQPPQTMLRTRLRCRNQTKALVRGEFLGVPTPCHHSRSDNEKTIPAPHRPPVHENRRNSKEMSEGFARKFHSASSSK